MRKAWAVTAAAILLSGSPVRLSGQGRQAPGEAARLVRWALRIGGGEAEPDSASHAEAVAIRRPLPGRKAELKSTASNTEVWTRPLGEGQVAVGAFNRGERAAQVDVVWKELGIGGQPKVRDVLNEVDLGKVHSGFAVKLSAGGAALYRVMSGSKVK